MSRDEGLKVLLHDYGRYPFTVSLARGLAQRGHQVRYLYSAVNPTPPNRPGSTENLARGLSMQAVGGDLELTKSRFLLRWFQERAYGGRLVEELRSSSPQVVLSANTPLDAQARLQKVVLASRIPFIHWLQDLIGEATDSILGERMGLLGELIGRYYRQMEVGIVRRSDVVIAIGDPFREFLEGAGVPTDRIEIIENWADPVSIQVGSRENSWSRAHGLDRGFNFLYAGTLGYKHDPDVFLNLAAGMAGMEGVRVVVVAQGPQADNLERVARRLGLHNLIVHPFQTEKAFPDVLATGDVLLAGVSRHASRYSVPSKILAYLCAGRPILLSAGSDNPAAHLIENSQAGIVLSPGDEEALLKAAHRLVGQPVERRKMGSRARETAEARFRLGPIVDRFESLLIGTVQSAPGQSAMGSWSPKGQ